jgi:uncharacterized membrane protein
MCGLVAVSVTGRTYAQQWTWQTLDYPGGYSPKAALGIDGNNIVGDYIDSSGNEHGFLYDGASWTTLDYLGATKTVANGISGNGIVGDYTDSSANMHGFLLTVPEPASMALLALGGLLFSVVVPFPSLACW